VCVRGTLEYRFVLTRDARKQRVAGCDVASACVPLHINKAGRATAREPLSLKLANARRLAGCGGVHGMGGTLRVGMDFEIRPPLFWSSACRTPHAVHATQPVVLSSRHSPLRFGGACTPSRDLLDPRIAPARRAPETATAPSRRPGPASGPQSPTMLILLTGVPGLPVRSTNAQQC
jgi:hypothetical protein